MPLQSPRMVRVLIVEDEPLARFVGRRNLEDLGFLVIEAETCSRAIELIETIYFDAVVIDHRLPDGFGIDVVRQLRRKGCLMSVIYLSAEPEQITPEIREELKIDAVVAKPVGAEDLKSVMEQVARQKKEQAGVECEAGRDETTYCGRFIVAAAPKSLLARNVRDFQTLACDNPWLGLDLRATEKIDEEAVSELIKLAGHCRERGGRLCLIGLRSEIDRKLRAKQVDRECDLLLTLNGLESRGRRLSAACERTSLLDSSITRNRNDQGV
jgi:DNA-binding response OmpR family regulator